MSGFGNSSGNLFCQHGCAHAATVIRPIYGDVIVDTPDDVLVDQLLAQALGLQVLALLPESPTSASTQLAMLYAALAGLARS